MINNERNILFDSFAEVSNHSIILYDVILLYKMGCNKYGFDQNSNRHFIVLELSGRSKNTYNLCWSLAGTKQGCGQSC